MISKIKSEQSVQSASSVIQTKGIAQRRRGAEWISRFSVLHKPEINKNSHLDSKIKKNWNLEARSWKLTSDSSH